MAIFMPVSISVKPKARGSNAAGGVDRTIGGVDGAPGGDDVQLHPGNGAPVELQGRTSGIDFRRRSIHSPEDVELVMVQIDRDWIVDLKRRPLCAQRRRREYEKEE